MNIRHTVDMNLQPIAECNMVEELEQELEQQRSRHSERGPAVVVAVEAEVAVVVVVAAATVAVVDVAGVLVELVLRDNQRKGLDLGCNTEEWVHNGLYEAFETLQRTG